MIQFHEESKTFHLYNDQISYIFKILKNNQLGQLYYGKRIHDRDNFDHLFETRFSSVKKHEKSFE